MDEHKLQTGSLADPCGRLLVLTGLTLGPKLFNLFLITVPKDDTKSSMAVPADAVMVAQRSARQVVAAHWAEVHATFQ